MFRASRVPQALLQKFWQSQDSAAGHVTAPTVKEDSKMAGATVRDPIHQALRDRLEHLQEVGEAGVSVGHMAVGAALHVHQGHDDVAQRAQRLVDAGGLPEPLPRSP